MTEDILRGPFGKYYAERELREVWELLTEGFGHYECYDPLLPLKENVERLLGSHMRDAVETERQRVTNINADFYGKESFYLGDLHIETTN